MPQTSLQFYAFLARLLPKSFRAKLALVLFGAQGIVLGAVILYLTLFSESATDERWQIFWLVCAGTMLGAALAFLGLDALLAPMYLTTNSLTKYLDQQVVPTLPVNYRDTAGKLMADVQFVVSEHDRRVTKMDDTALTDHLTHALNRGASETRLRQEIEYAVSHLQPFALALLDLDQFKAINDNYGLATGDQCLRHIGQVIHDHIRKNDWLGRWGGDEFILVMHDIDPSQVKQLLARLNQALRDSPNPNLPPDMHLMFSLSIGATILRPGDTPDALLAKADAALYQSKMEGRGSINLLDERINKPTKRMPTGITGKN